MPKPVVAAINGACVGAGLGFALACDLRVAAAGATFATAFAAIGLTADSGLSATLARSVGAARAAELLLLGESFTAEQAAEWGLVRAVVPAEQVLDAALELARTLAAGPTAAYAEIKQALALGAVPRWTRCWPPRAPRRPASAAPRTTSAPSRPSWPSAARPSRAPD